MIPLLPVNHNVGGLCIVPKTHTNQMQKWMCDRFPDQQGHGDYLSLGDDDHLVKNNMGKLVECEPGDMIIWDSRTVHGGLVGTPSEEFMAGNDDLARLSFTVCMT